MSAARLIKITLVAAFAASVLMGAAGAAQAQAAEPWWHVTVSSRPGTLQRGKTATVVLLVTNLGDAPAEGSTQTITIANTLPNGLELLGMSAVTESASGKSTVIPCVPATLTCTFAGELPAYEEIEVEIEVEVGHKAVSGELDTATVEGGGAPSAASGSLSLAIGTETLFGVQSYEMSAEGEGGGAVERAGAHPFQLTTTEVLNQSFEGKPVEMAKDLEFELPAGLVGDPTPLPQCSLREFVTATDGGATDECRPETAVGVAVVQIEIETGVVENFSVPVFNLEPEAGEPARFGFWPSVAVLLDTSVRTGSDYGVTVSSDNITQAAGFLSAQVSFWGVPGSPVHDQDRGWACLKAAHGRSEYTCKPEEERSPAPFLTMPTACTGAMQAPMLADSWQRPGYFEEDALNSPLPALYGCNKLAFEPSINTTPDYEEASRPSGLSVDIHVPQELQTVAEGTAESAVKQIKVELPQGVTVNPGGAGGLQACSLEQIGFKGFNPADAAGMEFSSSYPSCPPQSKIATAVIHTPLLPNPLEGAVYLATPDELGTLEPTLNPFNSLLAMYLVAEDPVSGTLVKLPMHVELNETTGQVVTTVESPQLPFEDAELHFFGGGRAPLATPGLCGSYTSKAVFTPWSGQEPVTSSSTFDITSGPNGSPCPSDPRPFAPEFTAGTTNNQAGGYSELRTTMGHPDMDQPLGALSITLPEGLTGSLSKVKLCEEPQAAEGTCGAESLIGHTTVTAGLGSTPAVVARPGEVYITGPYDGAPFGLSIANPAEAGPFDLEKGSKCDCIVVRAKVEVNPITSQLTITSGRLPTMIKGIPLDLQHVQVAVSRPEFIVNPTSCEKLKIEGSISGGEGASVPISEPFQATNCASLAFKPSFTASTSAKTSKRDGASLHVAIVYPKGSQGTQADIREAKVELPKALPSELKTLQKACLAAVFAANPAGCPHESIVGHAKAITPILPVALEGPAYFVSYGGAKFPELVLVLQGDGVTIDLHGETFINEKTGVTSSTFKTVPDDPVESFEITLPEQEYSALGAPGGKLCSKKLVMPTYMVGQNGATFQQQTKIEVQGCADAITLVSRKVRNGKLTLKLSVPAAGKLTVTGKGVKSASKKASGRETLTLTLKLPKTKKTGKGKHAHKTRAKLKLKLAFKLSAKKGKKLTKTMTLHYKR